MNYSHSFFNRGSRAIAALLVTLALGFVAAGSTRADEPAVEAPPSISRLAETGQFDEVLARLQAEPARETADPKVKALTADIKRLEEHNAAHEAQRQTAYDAALAKALDRAKAGTLDEAMLSLLEAGTLTDDREALVKTPEVATLLETTRDAATRAAERNDWLEALTLYRDLESIFEDRSTYRAAAKDAERQVRLLRLYAPDELKKLYAQQAKRMGKEDVEPLALGSETWEQTLAGIDVSLLRQAMAHAARRHVTNTGYGPLALGAIDSIAAITRNPALQATFPTLADKEKVAAFEKGLAEIAKDLKDRQESLNYLDAAGALDKIADLNNATLQLPAPVLVYELGDGAMSPLDDFSNIIWPREREEFARNTQGKFFGVGIQISRRDSRLLVVSPLEDTPAQKAGIKAGDIIATVNGESTAGWSLDQAVRNITGPEGTLVTLGVERTGERDLLKFPIKRAEIKYESVKGWEHLPGGGWNYAIDPELRIGYIRLSQFLPQSADDIDAAVNAMQKTGGINGLILDLRYNPGGLLSSAIEVCDRFISAGTIVDTVGANGELTSEPAKAHAHKTYAPFPVVVLVNEGSASASEIVSGCLQAYDRATIVGMRSFGKGSVQNLYKLDGGRAVLKLTTEYYRLPNGRIIHRKPDAATWGIEPDIRVKMTPKQIGSLMEFRQDLDVLRDETVIEKLEDPKVDLPPVTTPTPAPGSAPGDAAPQTPEIKLPATAQDILEKGLDPQLETALLVLKTRLVAKDVVLAQKPDAK